MIERDNGTRPEVGKELRGATQWLRKPGSAHRTFYTFIGTVEWHESNALSSFSLPLAYISHPIGIRVYPNDGDAMRKVDS